MYLWLGWALLTACGSAPEISSVDPDQALPGATLKILGDGFAAGSEVWLVQGDQQIQVADANVRGPVLIEGTLPSGLAPGAWTVQLRQDGSTVDHGGLTVLGVEEESPCGGAYKANTQLSIPRELVVIDRFYTDGERETLRIPIPEIERVEYELIELEPGTLCSVIYMKKKDGRRVVFDDDTRLNLEPRAYKLGVQMKKPTTSTRKDVADDPRPVEEN